jgi:hypothetical protein
LLFFLPITTNNKQQTTNNKQQQQQQQSVSLPIIIKKANQNPFMVPSPIKPLTTATNLVGMLSHQKHVGRISFHV